MFHLHTYNSKINKTKCICTKGHSLCGVCNLQLYFYTYTEILYFYTKTYSSWTIAERPGVRFGGHPSFQSVSNFFDIILWQWLRSWLNTWMYVTLRDLNGLTDFDSDFFNRVGWLDSPQNSLIDFFWHFLHCCCLTYWQIAYEWNPKE